MNGTRLTLFPGMVLATLFLLCQGIPASAAETTLSERAAKVRQQMDARVTQVEREAAAARLQAAKEAVANNTTTVARRAAAPLVTPPGPGGTPNYMMANWAFSPPLRKFVDTLPGLGATKANNLGQYIPVGVPDTTTYPGSDYYEIELRQYTEKMHTNLPPTTLRGYVQVKNGVDVAPIHYLGPAIVAQRDRPVRIKFTNKLPTAAGGDLFIPVDTSVMGAGMGAKTMAGDPCDPTMADAMCASYTQNRATLHLHGGRTPWISDGSPHQWITPAGETTPYPKGVSVSNVPDMPDPGDGSMTFFYTNQQSARLMFYHDHSFGITRLNVYAGEAAPYIIQDQTEQELITANVIPAETIPLVIQDKSFVDASKILDTDPTWNWGSTPGTPNTGDLWLPHVYVPAQNPYDIEGVNPFGRWHYGPWFWPPTNNVVHGPIANPYYDANCTDPAALCAGQPPEVPGTPNPSMGMEAFFDTAVVNGTAFPTLTVDPKSYRFRILNAANDRFWNLQLYKADPATVSSDLRTLTEVKMVPAAPGNASFPETWPIDGREGGVPDPTMAGPSFIQIGNEGGFLPAPTVVPNQPIAWNLDPTTFNFGNVSDHALLLGPAERADVIIDFSAYRGQTLILYNDAPAAFPALDARYDYYTGAPDLSATGGHTGPQVGFGPNTRTIMQIKVADIAAAPAFDLTALQTAFAPTPTTPGVFEKSQDPIIVGQAAYNGVYSNATYPNATFPTTYSKYWGLSSITAEKISFKTIAGDLVDDLTMKRKAIQDEMGEAFDREYGRMSGNFGIEMPLGVAGQQNFILYGFTDIPTENIGAAMTPLTPVSGDGTQIWKITHNGVDTHPVHFHLFDVQLINRVGWDGAYRLPDANELGWKETVRISPLEDTIVALRPITPQQPFGIPDSIRLLNPTLPEGSMMGFNSIDPTTAQPYPVPVTNQPFNFGWEYVWHCHILSHEEMDMMRPMVFNAPRVLPAAPALTGTLAPGQFTLTWVDATPPLVSLGDPANEIGFRIERCTGASCSNYAPYGTALANQTTFVDTAIGGGTDYRYRVIAYNAAGDSPVSKSVTTLTATLTPSVASPQPTGAKITFTAAAIGADAGPYEYRFFWRPPNSGSYTEGRAYATDPTWTWDTANLGLAAGTYTILVHTRHVGSTVTPEAIKAITYQLIIPTATLTPGVPSPQTSGTAVTFTAAVVGGDAGPYEYRFYWRAPNTTTYTLGRTYGTSPTWTWDTATLGLPAGTYTILVHVRHVGSPLVAEFKKSIIYRLTPPVIPATGATLIPGVVSPQAPGAAITFTATATGGDAGPYEYRFLWRRSGTTTYNEGRAYAASSTWTWDTATLGLSAGSYAIRVEVRHVGSSVAFEASKAINYYLYWKATGATLTPDLPTPQLHGTAITFTAAATGGDVGPYEYRFLWRRSATTTYNEGRAYGTTPTWTWDTATLGLPAGSYAIRVEVRHVGSSVTFEASKAINFGLN